MNFNYENTFGESSATCTFCRIILSSDNDNSYLDSISICCDCKFLLLEELEATSPDPHHMGLSRRRHDSSESIESMFSHQFSQLIDLARLGPHTTSSRTSPSGSRRWRRVFTDTESDGFNSLHDETESNFSFRRYSYSAHEGDSDNGRTFVDDGHFGHLESDTDIDPMNAGYEWNSEDDEDDSEWEEADIEINTNLDRVPSNVDLLVDIEESEAWNYVGQSGDHRLVETESLERGAPPASVSFTINMTRVDINEDDLESVACAICKDSFGVGKVVNRLPCFHLFHSSCILPWLGTRNTCPLCRYELPTDDTDYEARKRSAGGDEYETARIPTRDVNNDVLANEGSDSDTNGIERGVSRNKWYSLAAPIFGIVGITLMLCFGNPSHDRRWRSPLRRESSPRRWWSFL